MLQHRTRKPPPLRPNARVAVTSPASPPDPERLGRGVSLLRNLGYDVQVGASCGAPRGSLHAGNDAARAAELAGFIMDPAVEAIFAARGGVGCMRLLPHLESLLGATAVPPKWIVGRSDLTAIHLALSGSRGWVGISGPMVATDLGAEAPQQSVIDATIRLMSDPAPLGRIETSVPLETWIPGPGFAEGILFPVNLSLLSSLVGTRYLPSLAGAILVLEEIEEPPHRIDRMLTQLRLSGAVGGIAGLVFAQFTSCHPREEAMPEAILAQLLQDHARMIGAPTIAGFPYGHEPVFHPLPVGTRARIQSDPGRPAALVLLEGATGDVTMKGDAT